MSGYDMKAFIREALSHFWRESYGNIYPALRQLTADGLIRRRTQRGIGTPNRHVYSLTARGHEVLREWLLSEAEEEPPIRSELLLKTFFGAEVAGESLEGHIARFAEQQQTRLEQLRSAEVQVQKALKTDANAFYWYLTLRRGLIAAEARLRWAEEAVRVLADRPARPRGRRRKAARRKP